jgi:hypothetical protein
MADGVYVASGNNLTITAVHTIIFINPGVTQSIRILRCYVDQSGTTVSQQLPVQLVTQVTAFPATGTGVTPAKTSMSDGASAIVSGTSGAAGTAGVNFTGSEGGTKTVIMGRAFNNLNGFEWIATPDEQIILNASATSGFGIYLPGTPTTLTGWNAGIVYQET